MAAAWAVVAMAAMLCLATLAVDIGSTYHLSAELQRVADTAALTLAETLGDISDATYQSTRVAAGRFRNSPENRRLSIDLADDDLILGRMATNAAGDTVFQANATPPDAVRVTVRATSEATHRVFLHAVGQALGVAEVNLSVTSLAAIVPTDYVIVMDVSQAMQADSVLAHESLGAMNLHDVWDDLGAPTFGRMTTFEDSPATMRHLTPFWHNAASIRRTLGLDRVAYPYPGGSWDEYIDYVRSELSRGPYAHRYGLRTWTDYVLTRHASRADTPTLKNTRQMPLFSVKQAVEELCGITGSLNCGDRLAVVTFASQAQLAETLTDDVGRVISAAYGQQAGAFGGGANLSAALELAIDELTCDAAERARHRRSIVVFSSGQIDQPGSAEVAAQSAMEKAALAADEGIAVTLISVGDSSNPKLLQHVADAARGVHVRLPRRSADDYADVLRQTLRQLSAVRDVRLVR
jgi:Mg-chelatase subunit ChlD